jgi:uncharacterized protein GlcG (DUF336 family)
LGLAGQLLLLTGGHLICLERIDGTMSAAASIAIGKASTAVAFKRPGIVLEQTIANERPAMNTLSHVSDFPFVPLMGSYPIEINEVIVGAIAVAGAGNGENDEKIALHAIHKFHNSF